MGDGNEKKTCQKWSERKRVAWERTADDVLFGEECTGLHFSLIACVAFWPFGGSNLTSFYPQPKW